LQIRVEDVIIKKRIRRDLGDLRPLMKSMQSYGLLNPIILNRQNELIAGHRRLESAKMLGWRTIQSIMVDKESELEKLELELEENLHRRNLSADELSDGYGRLEKLKNPGFFARLWEAVKRFFRRLFRRK
jgi:ParB family transcriptional regulator, chromosome partitioning protein